MIKDRMPPLAADRMTPAQKKAAAELAAGPRGGVRGPFIPLLRSPDLMDRLQKVGEYLRYQSSLETRLNEFLMLIVARQWAQQFEWFVHYPLALKAGLDRGVADAVADGRRPRGMAEDEELAHDFCDELLRTHGVSDATLPQRGRQIPRAGRDRHAGSDRLFHYGLDGDERGSHAAAG